MKYFLDCGANDGCSAQIFRKLYDPNNEFMIISFEPDPDLFKKFKGLPMCTPMNVAVSDKYGYVEFHRDVRDGRRAGGTLMNKKGDWVNEDVITVNSIDLSKWILESFTIHDEIWLKLDVEGSEYKIIPKMYKDGTLKYINKLFIEWHNYKLKDISDEKHKECVKMVKPIPQENWPGVENAERILGKNYSSNLSSIS